MTRVLQLKLKSTKTADALNRRRLKWNNKSALDGEQLSAQMVHEGACRMLIPFTLRKWLQALSKHWSRSSRHSPVKLKPVTANELSTSGSCMTIAWA